MEAPTQLLLGKAYQKLQNRAKACNHYKAALQKDAACVEVKDFTINLLSFAC